MAKRMFFMMLVLVVVFGGIFGYKAFINYEAGKGLAHYKKPPVTVSTEKVKRRQWTPMIHSTGGLRAVRGVQITGELGGKVAAIEFKSGQRVKKGDLLVKLDTTVERAQLEGERADLKLARQTLARKQKLRKRGLGSQSDLDTARAKYESAQAAIAGTRATIDKKQIVAPFTGTIGLRQVDLGQYIAPGTRIASLQTLDPIYLDFDLPQAKFPQVHDGQKVSLTLDAYPGRGFQGRITAIEPQVNNTTRSFPVRATLPNPKSELRPGMFGNVTLRIAGNRSVITVPATAIAYNPYGDFIYVVKKKSALAKHKDASRSDGKKPSDQDGGGAAPAHGDGDTLVATRRNVRTGEARGDQVQIVDGLKVGERIVIAGNNKLHEGDRVDINNTHLPKVQAKPANVKNY